MSKIVYVPEWLKQHLDVQGESLECLDELDIGSAIVSPEDVNNYLVAQVEFAKLLVATQVSQELPERIGNIYETGYGLMLHSAPRDPEARLKVSLALQNQAINYDALGIAAGGFGDKTFQVVNSTSGRVVFVVGSSSVPHEGETRTIKAICRNILCDVLSACHSRLRIHDGHVDKSSTLRENPVLASIYVSTLLAR